MSPIDQIYFRQLRSGHDIALLSHPATQLANYIYAIGDPESREAVLVDPAYAPEELLELLADDDMTLVGAFLTHYHADHAGGRIGGIEIAGIAKLLELVDVPVHAQQAERTWITESTGLPPSVLRVHEPGDIVRVGSLEVTCIHTPGHTPGSQCLHVANRLVTGDTLFLNGCGRTDFPGGDPDELYQSLFHRLGSMHGDTTIYCGHDYAERASMTFDEVRMTNPYLAPTDRRSWVRRFIA